MIILTNTTYTNYYEYKLRVIMVELLLLFIRLVNPSVLNYKTTKTNTRGLCLLYISTGLLVSCARIQQTSQIQHRSYFLLYNYVCI